MNHSELNYLIIRGFGHTGSSLLYDILNLDEQFESLINQELDFISGPDGLQDLETSLIKNWSILNSDIAIKRFISYVKILNRKVSVFSKFGYNYSRLVNKDFYRISLDFVDNITEFKYNAYWHYFDQNFNNLEFFFIRLIRKLLMLDIRKKQVMYFSNLSKGEYIRITQEYIEELFKPFHLKYQGKILLVDMVNKTADHSKLLNYFRKSKIIIVDRDPRDIYCDLVDARQFIGFDLSIQDNSLKYISWHNTIRRKNNMNNKNQLTIKFEDILFDSIKTIEKVYDFLGLDKSTIDEKKIHELTSKSIKNSGIWKDHNNQKVIEEIKSELFEDCYEIS